VTDAASGRVEPDDAFTTPARQLLAGLVATPSVSGAESDAAAVLAKFLRDHGRPVTVDAVGNVRAPAPDTPAGEDVLLTSHVDTVPGEVPVRVERVPASEARWGHTRVPDAEESTTPAADASVPDAEESVPELWGRGSVDATGPLAAMAVAAVETGASFVGVVREETDSRGARHLVDDRPAPAAVVNGEPSGWDALTLGYRGFLPATYTVETAAGHSSRPEPNAVQHATAWWHRVATEIADDGRGDADAADVDDTNVADVDDADTADVDDADGQTDTPTGVFESVTATPTSIEGGATGDGTVRATVEVGFRLPPGTTAASVREQVTALTDRGELDWGAPIPPATASPRTEVARAFRAAIRSHGGSPRLLRKTGTADANVFADAWGVPTVTYGPGDSALDHTADERLPLPALDRARDVLVDAVERLR
jgi:LysW-gamma-L-lysine carboxypeptidase